MKVNPKYLIYHDLIGLYAYSRLKLKISENNFTDIGTVVDESRNMLITEKNNIVKKYIKNDYIFRFKVPQEENLLLEVNGTKIVGRPENRLRSLRNKRWKK